MIFLVFMLSVLQAHVVCTPIEDIMDSALIRVDELETQLNQLNKNFPELYEKTYSGSPEQAKVLRDIDSLTSDIINEKLTNIQARKKADAIQNQIQYMYENLMLIYRRNQKPMFAELINEPALILANRIYEVDTPTGKISFSIHPKIVSEIFWDTSTISQNISFHFLKSISHGHAKGSGTGGIVRMKAEEAVMELKTVGRQGNHRLYGYLRNGHYRFILYISHHTQTSSNQARSTVIDRMSSDMLMSVTP